MLNLVTEEELFQNLNEEQKNRYRDLAIDLDDNVLFNDLLIEMQRVASFKMFNKSLVIDDIVFSKAMLLTIDVMRNKVKHLKNGDIAN